MSRGPVLVVQHVEAEAPYAIADALESAGIPWDVVRTDRHERPPAEAVGLAGLVVMGGPMSVYDEAFESSRAEVALLGDALARSVPTLGVCLGAQLLAAAAGAPVYPGPAPEIGWGPVTLTAAARDDRLFGALPVSFEVLHWHGDTYDLPPGAVHLARSERFAQQAFRAGRHAWGLQFHLEVDDKAVEGFATAFPDQAGKAPGGMAELLERAPAALRELGPTRDRVLRAFAEVVAEASRQA